MQTKKYKWRYFKAGGVCQADLKSGEDIANLKSLDKKIWAALSCPTHGLHFDQKTLDIIDADADGKIHAPDVMAAGAWVEGMLKNKDQLLDSSSKIKLSDIDDSCADGKAMLASVKQILSYLGKAGETEISLEDFADAEKIFAATRFNGDGVITEISCESDAQKTALADIVASMGAEKDRCGLDGANLEKIDAFYSQVEKAVSWVDEASSLAGVLFAGEDTHAAYGAYAAIAGKIDEYFELALLKDFNRPLYDEKFAPFKPEDGKLFSERLRAMPLSSEGSRERLDLCANINPAWLAESENFVALTLSKILGEGKTALAPDEWKKMKADFAHYGEWVKTKPEGPVFAMDIARLRALAKENISGELRKLVELDEAEREHAESIDRVEKFLRLNRYFYELLTNFTNFRTFYEGKEFAVFQYGTLYIDRRECRFCLKVNDAAKHAASAPSSYMYLVYCLCTRKGMPDMTIAAAITAGECSNISVGRNGLFFDREGNDWDATVKSIVENPVSISEAFWAPYKRAAKWIGGLISKHASAADEGVGKNLGDHVEAAQAAPAGAPAKKMDIGTVAALGVAVGGITAALGVFMKTFVDMGPWMPLGLLGIIFAISLPSVILAAIKLRARNFGPLLDANGWAVNTLARISISFGGRLTRRAHVPPHAKVDKSLSTTREMFWTLRIFTVCLIALVCWGSWYFGAVNKMAPDLLPDSSWVKDRKDAAKAKADADAAAGKKAADDAAAQAAPTPLPAAPAQ